MSVYGPWIGGELAVPLPVGEGPAQLVFISEGQPGQAGGIDGDVLVEPAA